MKPLIVIISIALSLSMVAQKKDSIAFHIADSSELPFAQVLSYHSGPWCIGFYTSNNYGRSEISFCSDSTMKIDGDTAMAVGNMMDWINSVQTRFINAQLVLNRIDLDELAKIAGSKQFTEAVRRYKKGEADEEKRLTDRVKQNK
jgi:hypothetical protein